MMGGITAALLNLLRSRRLIGKWRDIQRVTDAKQDLIESLMKAGVAPPPPSATTPQPQLKAKAPAADATTTDKKVASLSGAKSLMTRLATESLRFVANQENFSTVAARPARSERSAGIRRLPANLRQRSILPPPPLPYGPTQPRLGAWRPP